MDLGATRKDKKLLHGSCDESPCHGVETRMKVAQAVPIGNFIFRQGKLWHLKAQGVQVSACQC